MLGAPGNVKPITWKQFLGLMRDFGVTDSTQIRNASTVPSSDGTVSIMLTIRQMDLKPPKKNRVKRDK